MKTIIFEDPILQRIHTEVTEKFGSLAPITIGKPETYFGSLAESIIGQQLSNKVADVITERVKTAVGGQWQPKIVFEMPIEQLLQAGLSSAKANYLKNIAEAWLNGTITPHVLTEMEDEEVIERLITIKGVGRWTAEMFLIFTLGRPDVFSVGDYGLRKAISRYYDIPMTAKPTAFLEITHSWQPHRSTASRILWKSLELK